MFTIDSLRVGQSARITGFGEMDKSLRARLYGLGFHTGATVELAHIAPLGCPLAIKLGNGLISLRRTEAKHLKLEFL